MADVPDEPVPDPCAGAASGGIQYSCDVRCCKGDITAGAYAAAAVYYRCGRRDAGIWDYKSYDRQRTALVCGEKVWGEGRCMEREDDMAEITVIVPVYNVARYLPE